MHCKTYCYRKKKYWGEDHKPLFTCLTVSPFISGSASAGVGVYTVCTCCPVLTWVRIAVIVIWSFNQTICGNNKTRDILHTIITPSLFWFFICWEFLLCPCRVISNIRSVIDCIFTSGCLNKIKCFL